ncbi:MAG: glucodextranase DOMON-like domain-containing protein [Chloroflexota bacterium]|nr:glucodextranase DOMON-like domain-containing protein [Chloroflexota bacterium]
METTHRLHRLAAIAALIATVLLLASCRTTPAPTPTTMPTPPPTEEPSPTPAPTVASEDVIHLAIVWHQHQPVYFKDPETGVYAKPWVRVHAAKDYYDMAALLKEYPRVHTAFNITPSLIRQLDDFAAGATDKYWEMTMVPADELTEEQKRFILRRFFDINSKIIERFPRYIELQAMRAGAGDEEIQAALESWTAQDFRDLQVLFNLAWTDPSFLAQEPLASLVEKERDYSEEDKAIILDEHLRILKAVIPLHREMQEAGQIEVTMTPFAHPILPLLVDTNLAKVAMPSAELPVPPFRYGEDAAAQVARGVSMYQEHFGADPRGMWPAEGSVAQIIVNMVGDAGIRWMASDEGVLAKSLGMDSFGRDTDDVVQEADALYRPYTVMGAQEIPVAIVFRDTVISDKVGFTYSGLPGDVAAEDFINRIHAIHDRLREQGAGGPNLVTVILDGENAWEYYPNDGKAFLHNLYRMLSEDERIVTVTPTEYLEKFPEEPTRQIDDLWPGSWINHDFSTWIGEDEENRAWDYLRRVRETLQKHQSGVRTPPSEGALEEALTQMYIAEGSDWFWWYGADQNSGSDEDFDRQYRDTLRQVLTTLGEEPPDWLSVPIIAESPAPAEQAASGLISPTIDGLVSEGEWESAGYYSVGAGAMAPGRVPMDRLVYGFSAENLYLRVDAGAHWSALTTAGGNPNARAYLGFYLLAPGGGTASAFSRFGKPDTYLGFGATRLLEIVFAANAEIVDVTFSTFDGERWVAQEPPDAEALIPVAVSGSTLELALPLEVLAPAVAGEGSAIASGDRVQVRAVYSQGTTDDATDLVIMPPSGPALVVVPDLGLTTEVLETTDPENDDYGLGSYTYPTDAVFQPGVFDMTAFSVGYDDTYIVFRLTLRGALENVWDSPNGVSVQTVDIYVDKDGPGSGERLLLPGRNAALTPDYAWDYAVWVEGWTPGVYVPGDEAPTQVDAELVVIADPGQSKITIKVPRAVLGDEPGNWAYAAAVLGQEGFPASGVWRVRDVEEEAAQWRFGGAPADTTNHTRIIDLAWPADAEPTQEQMLSDYPPSQESDMGQLGPEGFAQVEMLQPE